MLRSSLLRFAFALLLLIPSAVLAQSPLVIGEHLRDTVLETPHPYPSGHESVAKPVWTDHFYDPDAD
jgi:hypothetical protein